MLYDMENDPQQFTNLSGKTEYAGMEEDLRKRLEERIALARKSE